MAGSYSSMAPYVSPLLTNKKDPFEILRDYIDLNPPKSGYSPYDSYFGKGKYNYKADNTITVNTPSKSNIVFLLKDVY